MCEVKIYPLRRGSLETKEKTISFLKKILTSETFIDYMSADDGFKMDDYEKIIMAAIQ